jgi:hypothetical protein
MTCLTVTEYGNWQRWPWIYSLCHSYNPVSLSSILTYHMVFNKSKTTSVINVCLLSLFYCPLIYGFWLPLWFMASDYPFDLWLLITPLIYGFWLPLLIIPSDYPFGIFNLFSHPVRTGIERGSGFFHRKVQPFREKRRLVVWDQSKTKLSINKKRSRLLYTAAIPSSTTIF